QESIALLDLLEHLIDHGERERAASKIGLSAFGIGVGPPNLVAFVRRFAARPKTDASFMFFFSFLYAPAVRRYVTSTARSGRSQIEARERVVVPAAPRADVE